MKKFNLKMYFLIVLFFGTISAMAQVGIGTTSPDGSAMLDIDVSTLDPTLEKKGILIPRMTTTEREAISTPANGLLVFDTTENSFWYYTIAWTELSNGSPSKIADLDGDTKIEVEKNSDEDIIRFSTANAVGDASVERMTIDNAGVTKIGDGTNYTKITTDGSLSYEGEATRWDDLKVPVNSVKIRDKKLDVDIDPAYWAEFIGETGLLWFDDKSSASEQSVTFTMQMPHGWKEGSDIFPHVHWSTLTAPGDTRVTWGLEYTWVSVGGKFPNTTIITGTTVATPNTGSIEAKEHIITPIGSGIIGTGKTLSSMLVCRLFRNSSASTDDFSGSVGLLEIDFHYQIDSDGSNEQYTKY